MIFFFLLPVTVITVCPLVIQGVAETGLVAGGS